MKNGRTAIWIIIDPLSILLPVAAEMIGHAKYTIRAAKYINPDSTLARLL